MTLGMNYSFIPASASYRLANQTAVFFVHVFGSEVTYSYSCELTMANKLPELDEKLIEAVRGFACLWEVNSKLYKDNIAKENAWKTIGEQVYTCT